jgi:hypothetical protein
MTVTGERDDLFGRAARVVGDLDHPFYAEERQREVWNEASAVGMQAMLWGSLGLACAMTWIGGGELLPWAVALLAVVGASSAFMIAYARRQGVHGDEDVRIARPRTFLALALYVAALAGALVRGGSSWESSTVAGLIVGGFVGAAVLFVGRRLTRGASDGDDEPGT